jgi:hypothetical protein
VGSRAWSGGAAPERNRPNVSLTADPPSKTPPQPPVSSISPPRSDDNPSLTRVPRKDHQAPLLSPIQLPAISTSGREKPLGKGGGIVLAILIFLALAVLRSGCHNRSRYQHEPVRPPEIKMPDPIVIPPRPMINFDEIRRQEQERRKKEGAHPGDIFAPPAKPEGRIDKAPGGDLTGQRPSGDDGGRNPGNPAGRDPLPPPTAEDERP